MLKKTLSELSELNGGPGFEQDVSDYIIERMKSLGIDEYYLDVMGNLFVKIEGSDPHASIVLLDAHMDEPCFMVKYIDEKGYIYVTQTGLFSSNILFGQRVRIQTPYGNIKGCFGIKSYHISSSEGFIDPKLEDMWIDIGATCREDVLESGIKAGYPVIFDEPFVELANDYVMGKAFDNRVGCAALIGVMEDLVKEKAKSTVYFTFSVQEELLLRGANVIFNGIRKFFGRIPDFCIAYDISLGGDTPFVKKQKAPIELGKGLGIKILDQSVASPHFVNIVPRKVVDFLQHQAEADGLRFQDDFLLGTTNANIFAIEDIGVLTGGLSIPCRYTHSPVEIVCMSDLEDCIKVSLSAIRNVEALFK